MEETGDVKRKVKDTTAEKIRTEDTGAEETAEEKQPERNMRERKTIFMYYNEHK